MYIFYLDDSSEGHNYGFCALGVPSESWLATFEAIKRVRQKMRNTDGISVRRELHATEFVAGRGRLGSRPVHKGRRRVIFRGVLEYLARMNQLVLLSALMTDQNKAYEWLMNRINRTMVEFKSHAIIISDQGKEGDYTRLARKMSVYNPIPSKFRTWADGNPLKNITTDRLIEDPIFRDSAKSYFLQIADFCAYALIRHFRGVPAHKEHYGLHTAFKLLEPICYKPANPKHSLGVIGQYDQE